MKHGKNYQMLWKEFSNFNQSQVMSTWRFASRFLFFNINLVITCFSNVYFSVVEKYFHSSEYNDNFLQAQLNWSKHTKKSDKNFKQTDDNGVDTNIPGGELYFNVKRFFKEYLENIATVNNNIFAHKYQTNWFVIVEWKRFTRWRFSSILC